MNHNHKHRNQVRITGGILRGRKLNFATIEGLRPTPDMVREKLFNWLGQDLTGQVVLDLFAGSGALGFESLSRYAKKVVFCDIDHRVIKQIEYHAKLFMIQQDIKITQQEGLHFLKKNSETFNIVLLDPPFVWQEWAKLFCLLKPHLKKHAWIYLEAAKLPEIPEWLSVYKTGKAGKSQFVLLQYL